jgi:Cyclin, N-terminal domain
MMAESISTMCHESATLRTSRSPLVSSPPLADFILHALRRTQYDKEIALAALYLLKRLHTRYPTTRAMSGHRLFLTAFMLSSKLISDNTYSTKSWYEVGQKLFSIPELNRMEREMIECLDWQVHIPPNELEKLTERPKGGPQWTTTSDKVLLAEGRSQYRTPDEADQWPLASSPSSSSTSSSYDGSGKWSARGSASSSLTSDDDGIQFGYEDKITIPTTSSPLIDFAYAKPSVW